MTIRGSTEKSPLEPRRHDTCAARARRSAVRTQRKTGRKLRALCVFVVRFEFFQRSHPCHPCTESCQIRKNLKVQSGTLEEGSEEGKPMAIADGRKTASFCRGAPVVSGEPRASSSPEMCLNRKPAITVSSPFSPNGE